MCIRTAPSVTERGRVTVPCKDWPSASASGGYGLDKGLSPGPRLPPRDRRWGMFGRRQSVRAGAFKSMRRRQLRSHAMRHGCGNLSQDRVFVLCGSTESEALSVAFAIHLDDRGVMDQSIDGRRRHGGIGKDRVPGRKRLVGGDSDAVSFVSMRDEFEQDAGLGLILTNIRDVVEHDEIVFVELLEGADQGEVAARDLQPLDHIDGLSEQDPFSGIDESMADGGQGVALASAAFAEHQEIIAVLDPVPAGTERQKVWFAQLRRGGEVEAGEGFSNRRFGLITMTLDAS
jgi:hypothetical protein